MNSHSRADLKLDEHLDGLYSYALMLCRNRAQAEDMLQETRLRALRAKDKLRPDSNEKGWLFTILRNIWLNHLRQSRSTPAMVELEVDENRAVDPAKDPLATYVSSLETEQVRAAIQQLPVDYREIIVLREYEELSYQEISAILKCP